MEIRRVIVAGLLVAGGFFAVPADSAAQARTVRIEGERLEDLRGLADYVNEGAQFVLDEAQELSNPGTRERALITSLRDFARQAAAFKARVDQYEARPWRIDSEVLRLRTSARRVNLRLRRVTAMRDTFEDWDALLADIANLQRVASGQDVNLRRPDGEWTQPDTPRDDRRPHNVEDALRGQRLTDFRRLTVDLDAQASKVQQMATRQRADYSQRGEALLRDLEHFSGEVRDIRLRAANDEVRPRDINTLVTHLLEDARKADTSMRTTRVFVSVWEEWARTIRILEEMNALVR